MDFSAVETVVRSYFFDDFPKRILDALVFGGVATGGWILVTGRGRRKVLRAFLNTHAELVDRLKVVLKAIADKQGAKTFKETTRRQLLATHKLLEGQQLHLFARLSETDQETLLEYFERIARVIKVVDFNIPAAWVEDDGPLDYDNLNPFKGRIEELFKPALEGAAATRKPMEETVGRLKSIVWSVYLLPVLRHGKLRMSDAKEIDTALKNFSAEFGGPPSNMSAVQKDWGDPQIGDSLLGAAVTE